MPPAAPFDMGAPNHIMPTKHIAIKIRRNEKKLVAGFKLLPLALMSFSSTSGVFISNQFITLFWAHGGILDFFQQKLNKFLLQKFVIGPDVWINQIKYIKRKPKRAHEYIENTNQET